MRYLTQKKIGLEANFGGKFQYIICMKYPFWQRVLALIKAHKITQQKFAEYVGINYDTFRGWIHHGRIPDSITGCDIADALGVTVEYLARGKDGGGAELRMKQVEKRKTVNALIKKQALELAQTSARLR